MKIANRTIGPHELPYCVAEISGNHCGSLENARRLVKAAKRAGAHAVKTQCYEAENITIDVKSPHFIVQNGLWRGRKLYELYKECETPFVWHKDLYKLARDEDIAIFSSVFDFKAIDFLETLGCPTYKIASFEITDIPLIEYATQTGKPLIISTGHASTKEVLDAYEASQKRAAFLHCTSEYPATVEKANLGRIGELRSLLGKDTLVGVSDHTIGNTVPIMSVALGACIIEKHLKLAVQEGDKKSEDDEFSLFPDDFRQMVEASCIAWEAMQKKETNKDTRQLRRSLYAIRDIKEGEVFSTQNIRSIRPGYGLPPKMLSKLLGTKSKRNWRRGEPLS